MFYIFRFAYSETILVSANYDAATCWEQNLQQQGSDVKELSAPFTTMIIVKKTQTQ